MTYLRGRLEKLEAKQSPMICKSAVRIIQRGELTDEQVQLLANADALGQLVIVRQIISPPLAGLIGGG